MKKIYLVSSLLFLLLLFYTNTLAENNDFNLPLADDLVLNNTSLGTDFWLAIPQNEVLNGNLEARGVEIVVTAPYNTAVTMEIPNLGLSRTKQVEAFKLTSFSSEDNDVTYAMEVTESETVTLKGIHLFADKPFAAWVINSKKFSAEGFQGVPTNYWGTKYYHCAYYDFHESNRSRGGGFIIIASEPSTKVTINLKGVGAGQTVFGKTIGETITVNLNAGNTYMVRGNGETSGIFDLSGTEIIASKPIGVISFHLRTMIPSICPEDRDNLNEMLTPTSMWGEKFYSVQLDRHPVGSRKGKGDLFRLINEEANTTVNCEFYDIGSYLKIGNRTLPMNKTAMFGELDPIMDINNSNEKTSIQGMANWTSDKPVQLIQYAFSNRWDGDNKWSPMSILVAPINQYIRSAVFCTPLKTGFQEHQMTLIALGNPNDPENAPIRSIKIDGEELCKTNPQILQNQIPNSEYYWIRLNVSTGAHYIQSKTKFYAYLVGFDAYNAYGYPIAQGFNIINNLDTASPKISKTTSCGDYELQADELTMGQPSDQPRQVDAGLSRIILIDELSYNYTLQIDNPENFKPQLRITTKKFSLNLIDKNKRGKAIFAVMDRAGNITIDSVIYAPPNIVAVPDSINFGKITLNKNKTVSLCIKNYSAEDYLVRSISNKNSKFKLNDIPDLPLVLHKDDSLIVNITYTPEFQLPDIIDTDTILITSDCLNKIVPLEGKVIWPKISLSDAFNFGRIKKGTKVCIDEINTVGFEIKNTGSAELRIDSINGLNIPFLITSPTDPLLPITLQPGDSTTIKSICFIPQDSGKFIDTLIIHSNAVSGDSNFIVSGQGYIPEDPNSINMENDDFAFEIAPNPSRAEFTISWSINTNYPISLELFDIKGIVVDRMLLSSNSGSIVYSSKDIPSGLYAIRIYGIFGSIIKKIIILK